MSNLNWYSYETKQEVSAVRIQWLKTNYFICSIVASESKIRKESCAQIKNKNIKYIIKPSLTLCDWNNTMFLKNHHQDENIRKLQWPGPGRYQWPGHQSDPSAVSAATLENIWGLVSRSFSLKTSWSDAAAVVCTEPSVSQNSLYRVIQCATQEDAMF